MNVMIFLCTPNQDARCSTCESGTTAATASALMILTASTSHFCTSSDASFSPDGCKAQEGPSGGLMPERDRQDKTLVSMGGQHTTFCSSDSQSECSKCLWHLGSSLLLSCDTKPSKDTPTSASWLDISAHQGTSTSTHKNL